MRFQIVVTALALTHSPRRRRQTFQYAKEWGFLPAPDTRATVPTITDDLYPLLRSGRVGASAVLILIDKSPNGLNS